MSSCPGKNSWPELVGRNGADAEKVIESENTRVNAIVVREGTPVIQDFRCDRVWVWVDGRGVVVRAPTIG
ncbi:Serine protease inhibitor- potato inhibitor I-type family protein [Striga hermonthica]|uniref:Serine protease inhibitor- potato inhibitor I-type family protein n=1 Tax=Striga hermonthica TaxID=68872 RepID=A0A9N7NFZ0_STRHE|nr:Serine protease inhibitor- potato inhibitor I-type family protein [Striga hermonthica]